MLKPEIEDNWRPYWNFKICVSLARIQNTTNDPAYIFYGSAIIVHILDPLAQKSFLRSKSKVEICHFYCFKRFYRGDRFLRRVPAFVAKPEVGVKLVSNFFQRGPFCARVDFIVAYGT